MSEIVYFQSSNLEPYPLEVVGESRYKDNIKSLFTELDLSDENGVDKEDFFAQLILEDKNIYDPNAVRIDIEDKTVGYLSRQNAPLYRQLLQILDFKNSIGSCFASIQGGFQLNDGEIADFGVHLDLDLSKPLKIITPQNISGTKSNIFLQINSFRKKHSKIFLILIIIISFILCGIIAEISRTVQ